MDLQRRKVVVVESGALQAPVVEPEAQGFDEMQRRARVGAEADRVAGVRRNFGFKQNDVEHRRHGGGRRHGRAPRVIGARNHALGRIREFDPVAPKFLDDAEIDRLLQIEQRVRIGCLAENTTIRIAAPTRRRSSGGSARSGQRACSPTICSRSSGIARSFSTGVSKGTRSVARMRSSGARPKLRTRLLRMSAFDITMSSPVSLRRRVVLMPMRSTVPENVSMLQEIADDERLVERDRQRGEQIAEDVLQRQCDRDAADAEAREQRRDVDAEILERDQDQQRDDQDAPEKPNDVERAGERAVDAALAPSGPNRNSTSARPRGRPAAGPG